MVEGRDPVQPKPLGNRDEARVRATKGKVCVAFDEFCRAGEVRGSQRFDPRVAVGIACRGDRPAGEVQLGRSVDSDSLASQPCELDRGARADREHDVDRAGGDARVLVGERRADQHV